MATQTSSSVRIPLPQEHGGWAMLLTPVVIALVVGRFQLMGVMALLGWVSAYCMRASVEVLMGHGASGKAGMPRATSQAAYMGLLLFGGLAAVLLGPVVIMRPVALFPLAAAALILGVVQLLANRGLTRSITAGILAVVGLMGGGPLFFLAAQGDVTARGWTLALAGFAFFGGSVFRVKTLARERKSEGFRVLSVTLHAVALAAAVGAAAVGVAGWLVPLALLAPLGWSIYGATKAGAAMNLAVIGKGEQWLTIAFGLLLMAALF